MIFNVSVYINIIRVNLIEFKFSVIMITGGRTPNNNDDGKRVELLHPDGTHMCELEPLPDKRVDHTQSGLITCGGSYTPNSCLIFSLSDGTWQSHGSTLKQRRRGLSSSRRGNTTLLIGGIDSDSSMTTEMISMDGIQKTSMKLEHPTK